MKLFSPGGPGLSAVAKPRLGDTDQRACELLPPRSVDYKASPYRRHRFHGRVPASKFRASLPSRGERLSFRAEGRRGRGGGREVWSGKGRWFKVEDQLGRGVAGREESNASDTTLRCNPVATPSDRPLNRSGSLLLSARQRGVREL